MLKNLLLAAVTALMIAGCVQTVPLPQVNASDPVWGLTPDHPPGGVLLQ